MTNSNTLRTTTLLFALLASSCAGDLDHSLAPLPITTMSSCERCEVDANAAEATFAGWGLEVKKPLLEKVDVYANNRNITSVIPEVTEARVQRVLKENEGNNAIWRRQERARQADHRRKYPRLYSR